MVTNRNLTINITSMIYIQIPYHHLTFGNDIKNDLAEAQ